MEAGIIIVFAVAGLCLLAIWYINGALVIPVGGKNIDLQICVYTTGEAPELEHTVSGLLWLIENGTMSGEIVICDAGMAEDARIRARMLEKRDLRIHYLENWENYESGKRAD